MRKIVKVGVISRDAYQKRTIAIAKGEYKPGKNEPKIWFESLRSMSQVLGNENQELLRIIIARTLKTLERYGIVDLTQEKNRLVPKVRATDFKVEFGLHYNAVFAS